MPTYASETSVSSEKSQQEIQRTLRRYGADQFMYGWNVDSAQVAFVMSERQIRFVLPMPDRNAREFTHTPGRNMRRMPAKQEEAYEQAVRQRWRALNLVIKAKLEAVEAGITTFEQEFAMMTVMSDGRTVAEHVLPRMREAIESGSMPPLFGASGPPAIDQ